MTRKEIIMADRRCQIMTESSEIISEKPKNLVWTDNFSAHSFYFHYCDSKLKVGIFIYISACRSEATLQNALFQIILVFDKASQFFFFLNSYFLKNRLFDQNCFTRKGGLDKMVVTTVG